MRRRAGRPFAALEAPWFRLHASELLLVLTLCLGPVLVPLRGEREHGLRAALHGVGRERAPRADTATRTPRRGPALRPAAVADIAWLVVGHGSCRRRRGGAPAIGGRAVGDWSLPLSLLSALLYALALPSFASADGPRAARLDLPGAAVRRPRLPPYPRSVFYGTAAGVLATMLVNYWLGTFHLLALQLATVLALAEYVAFMAAALLDRSARARRGCAVPRDARGVDGLRLAALARVPRVPVGDDRDLAVRRTSRRSRPRRSAACGWSASSSCS